MLVALKAERFILIDTMELRFDAGFNALTGETGAGKSIVVGALDLVLGRRASSDVVRPGAAQAEVEALFDLSENEPLIQRLNRSGIGCDGELVVRRVVQASGRSRSYLNGRLCAARELSELGPELADITSQHESASMADPRRHIAYLDRFAQLVDRCSELGRRVDELREVTEQMSAIHERERSRVEREAFLRYQLDAIEALAPEPGELDHLQAQRSRLKHAERLRSVTARVAVELDRSDDSLGDRLARLSAEISAAAELDPALEQPAGDIHECWCRLRDVAADMARYAERIEADPAELDRVGDRIFRLEQLLRQHGPSLDDVIDGAARIRQQLAELESADERLAELEQQRRKQLAKVSKLARRLSTGRRKAAQRLSRDISTQLAELDMGQARVVVEVKPTEGREAGLTIDGARLGRDGIDRVQFLIAPSAGAEPRPLGRIASGGELSRALLALKRSLGGHAAGPSGAGRGVGVQVFDEVDAGIGGATADRIGRCIADIARHRQVLCITHLAPIAAYADAHFVVTRSDDKRGATSQIEHVDNRRRVAELARMLSGERVTGSTTRAAKELLAAAKRATRPAVS